MKKQLLLTVLLLVLYGGLHAQTITDGLMMPKKTFCTGFMYGHETWKDYWQGEHKRDNESIGKFTSNSVTWMGTYGISRKVNVIAMLPYIKNQLSAGTLHEMHGIQDLTLAGKWNFLQLKVDTISSLKAFAGLAVSTPLTNYSPDFFPNSIGFASTRVSWRLNLNYNFHNGIYATLSGAYTWRSNVKLDRPTYYTSGELHNTNEVWMPNVLDGFAAIGYHKQALEVQVNYTAMLTAGGDDIRRQDMPFVSNRMNFGKAGVLAMYYLPYPKYLAVRATASYTVVGRNVGQSTTIMGGLMYTIFFTKDKELKGLSQ